MNRKMKTSMILFIILFLLLAAAVVYLIVYADGGSSHTDYPSLNASSLFGASVLQDHNPTPISTPMPTQSPEQVQMPILATAAPTPIPTPMPTLPPVPTPVPTVPPLPAGTVLNGGVFRSQTGTLMDIRSEWSAVVQDDATVSVNVTVICEHYQLECISGRTLTISLGDQSRQLEIPEIRDDVPGLKETVLGTTTFSVPLVTGRAATYPLEADWYFGGVYSNQQLPILTCGGNISFER